VIQALTVDKTFEAVVEDLLKKARISPLGLNCREVDTVDTEEDMGQIATGVKIVF
jgi:hypothetical protein